ncbi:hypothetical protein MF271_19285 (plasmid) [Deinococcus sp. KNUC1210]|uniref:hypothetical protein n=1 Tax=Deinococcus sp. KNUC1210 TaxID=2917691 RepID=UPI001EEFEF5D|nr:hypothetical protein [Deinococcus sp. KNUC1210]ULH17335.1 hypothetical protein MF271_19285 [Deinococcus sp. KNUC1210]
MNRRQIIRMYLLTSLRKRMWMLMLAAVVVGGFPLAAGLQPAFALMLSVIAALCTALAIAWSSYRRHEYEFNPDLYAPTNSLRRMQP